VETDIDYINSRIGIQINTEKAVQLLSKMGLGAKAADEKKIIVSVPPTRSDILHACDAMEDVAIAYGYNNIVKTVPKAFTAGSSLPINKLSDQLRKELAFAGYTEVLPLILVR
jgi:phenylalanyl-tRNA synthetase beta chain